MQRETPSANIEGRGKATLKQPHHTQEGGLHWVHSALSICTAHHLGEEGLQLGGTTTLLHMHTAVHHCMHKHSYL